MADKPTYEELERRVKQLESIGHNCKPTETALHASMLNSVDEIMYVADIDTYEILFVNKTTQEAFEKELIGGICYREFQGRDAPCDFCTNDIIIKQKPAPYRWEYYNPKLKRHYTIVDKIIKWPDGRNVRFELAVDITGRKKAEEALRDNRERFSAMFEHMSSGVAVYKPVNGGEDFIFTAFNRAAEKITNITSDDVIGNRLLDLFPNMDKSGLLGSLQKVYKTGITERVPPFYYEDNIRKGWREDLIYKLPTGEIVTLFDDVTDRFEAESKLKESEKKYKNLFKTMAQAAFYQKADGQIIDYNQKALEFFGLTEDQFLGRTSFDPAWKIIHEDGTDYPGETHPSLLALKTGKPVLNKTAGIFNPIRNEYVWLNINAVPEFGNGEEKPFQVFVTMHDITALKQMETALRESEARYKGVVEDTPVLICTFMRDGEITFVNGMYCDYFKKTKEELIGFNFLSFIPEEDRKGVMVNIRALTPESPIQSHEHKVITPGGKIVWQRWTNRAIFSANGNLTGYQAIGEDITDYKRTQKALQKNEEELRLIFDNSPVGIGTVDLLGNFVSTNPAYEKMVGYTKEELKGMSLFDVTHPDDRPINRDVFRRLFVAESGDFKIEKRYICKDGSLIHVNVNATAVMDHNGRPKFVTAFIDDITEQRLLEERLRQAQKMESIGSLAGGIAHDFNNILFPIVGMSELLLEDLPADSPEHENTREILKAGKRGADLVKQILAFSRQSEHKIIPYRVQHILKEVLRLIRATIPSNIEVIQDIQPDCGLVMADPTQMHQVVMNIITNASHAVEELTEGKITVRLREILLEEDNRETMGLRSGKYAQLSISDNGHGIPPELKSKIFDPYFTTKEQGKGTGLGLAVVYGIIKEHKGEITVESDVGKGTVFHVFLPVKAKKSVESVESKMAMLQTGREHILLVDDEESIVRLGSRMLSRLGYNVTFQVNSHEALKVFRANPNNFDLVITDMAMPNMTGDQLSEKLMEIRPDIPVIICTGFSERINEEKAGLFGVKGLLMKPVIKADLAKMVRKVLDEVKFEAHESRDVEFEKDPILRR